MNFLEKVITILIIVCVCFLFVGQAKADTVYISLENYNDTLLSEITPDSIVIVDTTIQLEQLIKISRQVGVYELVS